MATATAHREETAVWCVLHEEQEVPPEGLHLAQRYRKRAARRRRAPAAMDPAAMQGLIDQQLAKTLLAVEGALDAELEKTENLSTRTTSRGTR